MISKQHSSISTTKGGYCRTQIRRYAPKFMRTHRWPLCLVFNCSIYNSIVDIPIPVTDLHCMMYYDEFDNLVPYVPRSQLFILWMIDLLLKTNSYQLREGWAEWQTNWGRDGRSGCQTDGWADLRMDEQTDKETGIRTNKDGPTNPPIAIG